MNYTTIYELGESGLVSVHKILIRMVITGIDRSIDRSIEDRTRSTNFRVPTSYRNKSCPLRPATTRLSSFRFFFNTDKHLNKINISCKQSWGDLINSREDRFPEELIFPYNIDRVNSSFSKSNKNYGGQERTRIPRIYISNLLLARVKKVSETLHLSSLFLSSHRTTILLYYIFLFHFIFLFIFLSFFFFFFFTLFKIHCFYIRRQSMNNFIRNVESNNKYLSL